MSEREGLLAAILANPEADLPRLVYADWLDENGESERAEFIRLQIEKSKLIADKACAAYESGRCCRSTECTLCPIHRRENDLFLSLRQKPGWFEPVEYEHYCSPGVEAGMKLACVVRRGFVSEVHAPLSWLIGGTCPECQFWAADYSRPIEESHQHCRTCRGKKRTAGHLGELVKCQPVTWVQPTDREPEEGVNGQYSWYYRSYLPVAQNWRSDLPREIFSIMTNGVIPIRSGFLNFPDKQAAQQALSIALLQHARATQPTPQVGQEGE